MSSLDPVILSEVKKIQKAQSNPPATGDYSTIDIPIATGSSLVPGGLGFVDRYSEEILDKFSGQITSIPSIPVIGSGYNPNSYSFALAQLSNGNYLIAYQTSSSTQSWTSKTLFAIIDKDTGSVVSTVTTTGDTLTHFSSTTDHQGSYLQFITCSTPDRFILLISSYTGSTAAQAAVNIVPVSVTNNTISYYPHLANNTYVSGVSYPYMAGLFINLINFHLVDNNTLMVSCPYWTGSQITQIRYYKFTNIFLGAISVDTTTPATALPTTYSSLASGASSIRLSNNKVLMYLNNTTVGHVFDIDANGVLSNPVSMTINQISGYNNIYPQHLDRYLGGSAGYLKGGSYINGVFTSAVCFTITNTLESRSIPAVVTDVSPTGVVTLAPLKGYYEVFKEYVKPADTKWDINTYKDIVSASNKYLTIALPIGKFLLFNMYGAKSAATSQSTPIACGPHICRIASFLYPYKNIGFINSVNPPLANIKGVILDNNNYYTNIGNTYQFELDNKLLAPYTFIPEATLNYSFNFTILDDAANTKKITEVGVTEPSYVKISFGGSVISGRKVFIFVDGICVYKGSVSGSPTSSTIVWEGIVCNNLTVIPGAANTSGTVTNFNCYVSMYRGVPA